MNTEEISKMVPCDELVQSALGVASLAERADPVLLLKQAAIFNGNPLVQLLDSVTDLVLILNEFRQVVYANQRILDLLGMDSSREIVGMRPGELMGCEVAAIEAGGCGTSEDCKSCGSLRAIMCALHDRSRIDECRMTKRQGDQILCYDLKVCATPLELEGEQFVTFAITDISHEKRRQALERIFFHDILNTAGGLRSLAKMILEEVPLDLKDDTLLLHRFSSELVDEIMAQRVLLAAESDELSVDIESVCPLHLLETVHGFYASSSLGEGVLLRNEGGCEKTFKSDVTLARRILSNMVKNAIEASVEGDEVAMGCNEYPGGVMFWVKNPAVIAEDTQRQIFQRSFSTKGTGRGLGTYSMKLLASNFMKGSVGFSSSEGRGTRFWAKFPNL